MRDEEPPDWALPSWDALPADPTERGGGSERECEGIGRPTSPGDVLPQAPEPQRTQEV